MNQVSTHAEVVVCCSLGIAWIHWTKEATFRAHPHGNQDPAPDHASHGQIGGRVQGYVHVLHVPHDAREWDTYDRILNKTDDCALGKD